MQIEGLKLDFSDVLIIPKRSTLRSRKDVQLERTYTFLNSGETWTGVPIIASNMDTTGTFEMWKALSEHEMLTCIHKFYSEIDWLGFGEENQFFPTNIIYSIGASEEELATFEAILTRAKTWKNKVREVVKPWLCIDVANGYGIYLEKFIEWVRKIHPDLTIVAGNVVTKEMTQQLLLSGADIVKVGIGPGCFTPGAQVTTSNGNKNIEDVKEGDVVITHKGNWQKVTNTFKYQEDEKIVSVNGNKYTAHHEYYVVEKQYKDILTDDNIHEYAKWVKAEDLNKEKYFLLKHN
jgi:hypothetical protein